MIVFAVSIKFLRDTVSAIALYVLLILFQFVLLSLLEQSNDGDDDDDGTCSCWYFKESLNSK